MPKGRRAFTQEQAFWKKVDKTKKSSTGCWYWRGTKDSYGYARFGNGDLTRYIWGSSATRYIFWRLHGWLPPLVRHTCNQGHCGCVRPDHLIAGTAQDNANDRELTPHNRRGTNNGNAKTTEDTVLEVYSMKGTGLTSPQVAKLTGIPSRRVQSIWSGESWATLTSTVHREDQ